MYPHIYWEILTGPVMSPPPFYTLYNMTLGRCSQRFCNLAFLLFCLVGKLESHVRKNSLRVPSSPLKADLKRILSWHVVVAVHRG